MIFYYGFYLRGEDKAIENFFLKFINALLQIGETFVNWCTGRGIISIIEDLGLHALGSFIGSLITALINGMCQAMSEVASTVTGLLGMDIGEGTSFFEAVYGDFSWLTQIMKYTGFAFMSVIFLMSLIRIMTTPDENTETPLRLVSSYLATGFMIAFADKIILIVQSVFRPIYEYVLDVFQLDTIDTERFAKIVQDHIRESHWTIPGTTASKMTQLSALLQSIILLIIVVVAFVIFIKYMFEFIQRYVVLGVLIMTAPAAMSLACSKSTRVSFSKWIRMLICQFLLMSISVMFIAAFFSSMINIEDALNYLGSDETLAPLLLWGISMFAILNVGRSIDSYFRSLGLSVAETGRETATAFVTSMVLLGTGVFGNRRRNDREMKAIDNTGVFNAQDRTVLRDGNGHEFTRPERGSRETQVNDIATSDNTRPFGVKLISKDVKIQTNIPKNGMNGSRKQSVQGTVEAINSGNAMLSREGNGNAIIDSMKRMPMRLKSKLDSSSFRIKDGSIFCDTLPDNNGNSSTIKFTAISNEEGVNKRTEIYYGRSILINSQEYIATVESGPSSFRAYFLTYDTGMKRAMTQKYGNKVEAIHDGPRKWSGVYRVISNGPIEPTDPSGMNSSAEEAADTRQQMESNISFKYRSTTQPSKERVMKVQSSMHQLGNTGMEQIDRKKSSNACMPIEQAPDIAKISTLVSTTTGQYTDRNMGTTKKEIENGGNEIQRRSSESTTAHDLVNEEQTLEHGQTLHKYTDSTKWSEEPDEITRKSSSICEEQNKIQTSGVSKPAQGAAGSQRQNDDTKSATSRVMLHSDTLGSHSQKEEQKHGDEYAAAMFSRIDASEKHIELQEKETDWSGGKVPYRETKEAGTLGNENHVVNIQEWAASNCYMSDSMPSDEIELVNPYMIVSEHMKEADNLYPGDGVYIHYEIPMIKQTDGTLCGVCEVSEMPEDKGERYKWICEQFPDMEKRIGPGFDVIMQKQGITYIYADQREYQLGALSECRIEREDLSESNKASEGKLETKQIGTEVLKDNDTVQIIKANNGVKYLLLSSDRKSFDIEEGSETFGKSNMRLIPHHWNVNKEPFINHIASQASNHEKRSKRQKRKVK